MTLKLESTTTWTQKRLKLGMVSSFDPHSMCAKVERITTKTRCTSCTNWSISFKVRGFQMKTHLIQRHFIFLNLFQVKTFVCIQHATFKATYSNSAGSFPKEVIIFVARKNHFSFSECRK